MLGERAEAFETRKKNATARKELEQARDAFKAGPLKGVRLNGVRPALSPNKENSFAVDNDHVPDAFPFPDSEHLPQETGYNSTLPDDAVSAEDTSSDREAVPAHAEESGPRPYAVDSQIPSWLQDLSNTEVVETALAAAPVVSQYDFDRIIANFHQKFGEFQA